MYNIFNLRQEWIENYELLLVQHYFIYQVNEKNTNKAILTILQIFCQCVEIR